MRRRSWNFCQGYSSAPWLGVGSLPRTFRSPFLKPLKLRSAAEGLLPLGCWYEKKGSISKSAQSIEKDTLDLKAPCPYLCIRKNLQQQERKKHNCGLIREEKKTGCSSTTYETQQDDIQPRVPEEPSPKYFTLIIPPRSTYAVTSCAMKKLKPPLSKNTIRSEAIAISNKGIATSSKDATNVARALLLARRY